MSRRWITWFRRVLYPVLGLMVPFGKAASRGLVQIHAVRSRGVFAFKCY